MPGEMTVTKMPVKLTTVLGSCVSVCLHDRLKKITAMNHYLLPVNSKNDQETNKYGDTSLEKMLKVLLSMGADIQNISGYIFGGASMFDNNSVSFSVGAKNIEVALKFLQDNRIKIVSSSTGGTNGRKVTFNTATEKITIQTTGKGKVDFPDE